MCRGQGRGGKNIPITKRFNLPVKLFLDNPIRLIDKNKTKKKQTNEHTNGKGINKGTNKQAPQRTDKTPTNIHQPNKQTNTHTTNKKQVKYVNKNSNNNNSVVLCSSTVVLYKEYYITPK